MVEKFEGYPATAAEAKAMGVNRYFTGKPCPKGHVVLRKASNTTCTACHLLNKGGNVEARRAGQRIRNRRDRLALRGGCTPEMKEEMILAQHGACAICECKGEELFVDHCHAENKIRAALCRRCNLALGHAKDNPMNLRKMASYIEKHRSN